MKAVIMAGGRGTRLKPLTLKTPKPMVQILNKPVMTYAVELLKEHGIKDIAVTLQYLPEAVKQYFGDGSCNGVKMRYFEELTPLGTAGSVKNASEFLDQTFVVISGDGITDYNLTKAIEFHREKGGIATMVMAQVRNPLEYGVIMCDENNRIIRFLEKPCWGEVFSDTVNTGIYILEPEIFEYYERDVFFDFSKDLFPLLLSLGKPMYGYIASGYWSDIGSIEQYRRTAFEIMSGLIAVNIYGEKVEEGLWIGRNTVLEPGVDVRKPVFIGDNCTIRSGARLGEYAVIGSNSEIDENAAVRKSLIWHNSLLASNTSLDGCIICSNVTIGSGSTLGEDSVLGDNVIIGSGVTVKPQVKIWPDTNVREDMVVSSSLILNRANRMNLFSTFGVTGDVNREITPELAVRLGVAFGSVIPEGHYVVIGSDGTRPSTAIRKAMVSGLISAGVNIYDIGTANTPVTRYVVKSLDVKGGVHIRLSDGGLESKSVIEFLDSDGINVSKDIERKIENSIAQDDFRRANDDRFGEIKCVPHLVEAYRNGLVRVVNQDLIKRHRFRLLAVYDYNSLGWLISPLSESLDWRIIAVNSAGVHATNSAIYRLNGGNSVDCMAEQISNIMRSGQADLGFILNRNADSLTIITDSGEVIGEETMMALRSFITLDRVTGSEIGLPVFASSVHEKIAAVTGGNIIRTKCSPSSLMEMSRGEMFQPMFDGIYFLLKLLEYLREKDTNIAGVLKQIPQMYSLRKEVYCPFSKKGIVMRRLVDMLKKEKVELLDGIKVYGSEGWTLILPDGDEPLFSVVSEAGNLEDAEALTDFYVRIIDGLRDDC